MEIIWQIHADYAYQAYSRLKELHPQTFITGNHYVSSCNGSKSGKDYLFCGKIGPIELYSLPQEFEWSALSSSNFDEIIDLSE